MLKFELKQLAELAVLPERDARPLLMRMLQECPGASVLHLSLHLTRSLSSACINSMLQGLCTVMLCPDASHCYDDARSSILTG